MNPEFFDIETLKMVGLWPNPEQPGRNLLPYVKRLRSESVIGLDYGMAKGEDIRILLDECSKISRIDSIFDSKSEYVEVAKKNLDGFDKVNVITELPKDVTYDFIIVNTENNVASVLNTCYNLLKSGGIFAGTNHAQFRDTIVKFRNDNKIRIPINITHNTWFWIKQ